MIGCVPVDVPAATFLDLSVSELLEEVASAQPAPGGTIRVIEIAKELTCAAALSAC